MLSAVNASVTITLFKYNITHFNSVATEQLIMLLMLAIAYFILAKVFKERILHVFCKPLLVTEAVSLGGSGLLTSFAYACIPASMAITISRSLSVFWSVVFGKAYLEEIHLIPKLIGCVVVVPGIFLLAR